jgi:hypothetical protein
MTMVGMSSAVLVSELAAEYTTAVAVEVEGTTAVAVAEVEGTTAVAVEGTTAVAVAEVEGGTTVAEIELYSSSVIKSTRAPMLARNALWVQRCVRSLVCITQLLKGQAPRMHALDGLIIV